MSEGESERGGERDLKAACVRIARQYHFFRLIDTNIKQVYILWKILLFPFWSKNSLRCFFRFWRPLTVSRLPHLLSDEERCNLIPNGFYSDDKNRKNQNMVVASWSEIMHRQWLTSGIYLQSCMQLFHLKTLFVHEFNSAFLISSFLLAHFFRLGIWLLSSHNLICWPRIY